MINNINNYSQSNNIYKTAKKENDNKQISDKKNTTNNSEDVAATYEKSSTQGIPVQKPSNEDIIAKLKADTEMRTAQLESLVQKMFSKQGITVSNSSDIYSILRSGEFTVDPEIAAQAKKDIAEDGYWGVTQTSDRMVDFAIALAGNDPTKADKMISAVKKGYEDAKKTWGGELPEICQQTFDRTISKLEEWRDGKTEEQVEV